MSRRKANCVGRGHGNGIAKIVRMVWTKSNGGGGPKLHVIAAGMRARPEGGSIGDVLVSGAEGNDGVNRALKCARLEMSGGLKGVEGSGRLWKVVMLVVEGCGVVVIRIGEVFSNSPISSWASSSARSFAWAILVASFVI